MKTRKDLYLNLIKEFQWTPDQIKNMPISTILALYSSDGDFGGLDKESFKEIAKKNKEALVEIKDG